MVNNCLINIEDVAYVVANMAWTSRSNAKRVVADAVSAVPGTQYNWTHDIVVIKATTSDQAQGLWDKVWQYIKESINKVKNAA